MGGSDVSLVEFIPKEINYLNGVINEAEFVNLDFLIDIDANEKLLITFEQTGTIHPALMVCQFLKAHLDLT